MIITDAEATVAVNTGPDGVENPDDTSEHGSNMYTFEAER